MPDLTLQEAADRLGVHYMTVYRAVRTGRLPASKVDGAWGVRAEDLDAYASGRPIDGLATRPRLRIQLESRLLAGDEAGAWTIVEQAIASATDPAILHTELILPALHSIGDRWADGEISVLDEHQASTIAGRVVARLGPRFRSTPAPDRVIVIGAPTGERHGLVTAIMSDLLRGRGFDVIDLGADTPPASFVDTITTAMDGSRTLAAVVVAIQHSDGAAFLAETISAIRTVTDVPILLGGNGVPSDITTSENDARYLAGTADDLLRIVDDSL